VEEPLWKLLYKPFTAEHVQHHAMLCIICVACTNKLKHPRASADAVPATSPIEQQGRFPGPAAEVWCRSTAHSCAGCG
jgi:hypothetical protein